MKIIDLYLVAEFGSAFEKDHFLWTAKRYLNFFVNNVFSRVKNEIGTYKVLYCKEITI